MHQTSNEANNSVASLPPEHTFHPQKHNPNDCIASNQSFLLYPQPTRQYCWWHSLHPHYAIFVRHSKPFQTTKWTPKVLLPRMQGLPCEFLRCQQWTLFFCGLSEYGCCCVERIVLWRRAAECGDIAKRFVLVDMRREQLYIYTLIRSSFRLNKNHSMSDAMSQLIDRYFKHNHLWAPEMLRINRRRCRNRNEHGIHLQPSQH